MTFYKKYLIVFFLIISFSFNFAQDSVKFKSPVLISSAGQSADVKLAQLIFKKEGIEQTTLNTAKAGNLDSINTLVLVPGFSSKGLGAAGISVDDELKRVKDLIEAAEQKNIPIVLLHIGGKARRKGRSDNFIKEVANAARYMIVVEQGNEDGFFTKLSEDNKIPLILVDKIPSAAGPIGNLF